MAKVDEKAKVKYEPEIITSKVTFESPIDISQVPVFTVENCEVLFSSLTSETPKYGHSLSFMLPVDSTLPATDKTMRSQYLQNQQQIDPNIEYVKGSISLVAQKDVLDGKFTEDKLGRAYTQISISNPCMFDETINAEGKKEYKKIDKVSDAKGEAVVKYFRVLDAWTGEGIEPDIYKYENGNKVTTFVNPKTKEEKPIYLSSGDIVNVKLRPYVKKNGKTGELTFRYNLLSVEQVQTAWDRGIGRTGSKSKTQEAPDTVSTSSLGSIFAGIGGVTVAQTASAPKVEPTPAQKAQPAPQPIVTPTVTVAQEQTPAPATNDGLDFNNLFKSLENLDMSGVNLGE